MELNGALSNPFVKGKRVDLAKLVALKSRLLAREGGRGGPLRRLPRRQGSVLAAVTRVLELSGEPMMVSDIHEAVKCVLDDGVPLSTVKDALSAHAVGGGRRFRRIRHGIYELAGRR